MSDFASIWSSSCQQRLRREWNNSSSSVWVFLNSYFILVFYSGSGLAGILSFSCVVQNFQPPNSNDLAFFILRFWRFKKSILYFWKIFIIFHVVQFVHGTTISTGQGQWDNKFVTNKKPIIGVFFFVGSKQGFL